MKSTEVYNSRRLTLLHTRMCIYIVLNLSWSHATQLVMCARAHVMRRKSVHGIWNSDVMLHVREFVWKLSET